MSPRRGETPVVPDIEPRTYYDQPVLKEPVWKWEIPVYFFTGGSRPAPRSSRPRPIGG